MPTRQQCDVFWYAKEVSQRGVLAIDYAKSLMANVGSAQSDGKTNEELWAISYLHQLPPRSDARELVERAHSDEDLGALSPQESGRMGGQVGVFYKKLNKLNLYLPGVGYLMRQNNR